MKTMVRQESVRFGVVLQCGKQWAFIRPDDEGRETRLYWSHLRRVESTHGGIVFATGMENSIRRGDPVVFVSRKESYWLWALRADYDTAVNFLQQNSTPLATPTAPPPMTPTPPAPIINLEQEMAALGSERLRSWKRRYSGNPRAFA